MRRCARVCVRLCVRVYVCACACMCVFVSSYDLTWLVCIDMACVHGKVHVCIEAAVYHQGMPKYTVIHVAAKDMHAQTHAYPHMHRVGQIRIYTYIYTVYLVISEPKIPYVHRIYMVLANPTHARTHTHTHVHTHSHMYTYTHICTEAQVTSVRCSPQWEGPLRRRPERTHTHPCTHTCTHVLTHRGTRNWCEVSTSVGETSAEATHKEEEECKDTDSSVTFTVSASAEEGCVV